MAISLRFFFDTRSAWKDNEYPINWFERGLTTATPRPCAPGTEVSGVSAPPCERIWALCFRKSPILVGRSFGYFVKNPWICTSVRRASKALPKDKEVAGYRRPTSIL